MPIAQHSKKTSNYAGTGTLDMPLQIQEQTLSNQDQLHSSNSGGGGEIEDEIARLRRENEVLKQSLIMSKQKQQLLQMNHRGIATMQVPPSSSGEMSSGAQALIGMIQTANPYQQNLYNSTKKLNFNAPPRNVSSSGIAAISSQNNNETTSHHINAMGYSPDLPRNSYDDMMMSRNHLEKQQQMSPAPLIQKQEFTISPIRESPMAAMSFTQRDINEDPSSMLLSNNLQKQSNNGTLNQRDASPYSNTAGFNIRMGKKQSMDAVYGSPGDYYNDQEYEQLR